VEGFCSLLVYALVLSTRVLDTACSLLCELVTVCSINLYSYLNTKELLKLHKKIIVSPSNSSYSAADD
jgi:hypothetical protein